MTDSIRSSVDSWESYRFNNSRKKETGKSETVEPHYYTDLASTPNENHAYYNDRSEYVAIVSAQEMPKQTQSNGCRIGRVVKSLLVVIILTLLILAVSLGAYNYLHLNGYLNRGTDSNLLMVVSGYGGENKVEIIDLSRTHKTCPHLADFYGSHEGAVGTYIDGKAIVCGGGTLKTVSNKCYEYHPKANEWTETGPMVEARGFAAGVQISPTEWWITGGWNNEMVRINGVWSNNIVRSTEIYMVGQGSPYSHTSHVALPEGAIPPHNMLRVNATHYILVGDRQMRMFDKQKLSAAWNLLPVTPTPRHRAFSGLVTYPDGSKAVVVAGGKGSRSSDIFNLNNLAKKDGPRLPTSQLHSGASVQYGDSFIIVGGHNGDSNSRAVYRFDAAAEDWVEFPQKLKFARMNLAAFLVPYDFVKCY